MRYAEALAALEDRQEARMELGLERVAAHLGRLGRPQERFGSIHVAGTNGKGSTCAILESVLRASGRRTGLYTSPHLTHPRERIKVSGAEISEADFARLMERALRADSGARLTYFELLTSIAFQHFAEKDVDVAVLETGLGGRLDATNVVERPLASVITSIDFDHKAFLGDTLSEIAGEKAGIIKAGRPVFIPKLPAEAAKVIKARARSLAAPLTVVEEPWRTVAVDWAANRQELEDPEGRRWTLSLLGDRQGRNAALARAVLTAPGVFGAGVPLPLKTGSGLTAPGVFGAGVPLPLKTGSGLPLPGFRRGLESVRLPGRFEVRGHRGRTLVLDGAHNPEAMRCLRRTLEVSPWRDVRFVLGVLKDKDAAAMARALGPLLKDAAVLRPASPRALAAEELARVIRRLRPAARVKVARDFDDALDGAPQTAVVCGSFYLVGELEKVLS